ncbi:MAG: YdeI/OmpD-associated family protein [Geodermatophilaceae bacterium]|nr:YdeI/OmpD-associated family protein [Geodermatophilaceae bacterium]MDQ3455295.1 YdeI/OmpD-associated family protein [Actinomycetota bacterium]
MTEDRCQPATVEEWRVWLAEHQDTATGVWLVTWKQHTDRPTVSYDDAVTEAIAVGWIDSKGQRLDDDRTMLWFCPRKATSGWSRPNKQRVQRLYAADRMQPAGQRAIDVAKANGAWTLLDAVEDLAVPEDLAAAFDRHPGARNAWEAFPRSAKRGILEWIVQAKRPETRAKRVAETARLAAEGIRANEPRRR